MSESQKEMKNQFELFKLHNAREDIKPKSWICVSGKNIQSILNTILNEMLQNNHKSKRQLSEIIAHKLNCNLYTIYNFLRGKRQFIPIIVILNLLDIYRQTLNKSVLDIEKVKQKIQDAIELLKNNNSKSVPVRALKELNKDLARIAGAYAADGNMTLVIKFLSSNLIKLKNFRSSLKKFLSYKLSKKYTRIIHEKYGYEFTLLLNSDENKKLLTFIRNIDLSGIFLLREIVITIVDEYKESLEYLVQWIENCFGIKPTIKKLNNQNAWYIKISNKIIGRYFNLFLGFSFGKKYETVKEPKIIKNSPFNLRNAFAQGVITFDGSVSTDGRLIISLKSRYLIRSLSEILQQKINSKLFEQTFKNGTFTIRTRKSVTEYPKLLEFLIEGTEKYRMFYQFIYGCQQKAKTSDIINFLKKFPRHSEIKMITVFRAAKELKTFTTKDITAYIKNTKGIVSSKETINSLVRILCLMNIVRKRLKIYVRVEKNFREKLFQSALEKLKSRKKLGELLDVTPETTYDYHFGRVNIPYEKLVKIIELVDLNLTDISNKILFQREGINPSKPTFEFNPNSIEWRLFNLSQTN